MLIRIASAAAMAPVLLGLLMWPGGPIPFRGWPFALLITGLALTALHELYQALRAGGYAPRERQGVVGVLLCLAAASPFMPQDRGLFILEGGLALLVMISLGLEAVRPDRSPLKNLPVTWLAVLYVGWLFSFALRMRVMDQTPITRLANVTRITGEGAWLVLYTQLVVSAADTGAYLVGRAIGRHKMAPAVSPGKTWEGAAGGFVAAVAVAWFGGGFLGLPPVMSGVSGVALGLLAPLGDLAKSAMKREVGIKDFGNLIPGHGGVLDRFDSLLFSAPLVYLLARFWA